MWIFLSTILVLFVFSAGFRKGCLAVLLIFIGIGYYIYSEHTPQSATSHPTPASSRAIRAAKPSSAKNKSQIAAPQPARHQDPTVPPADSQAAGSTGPADESGADP
jgi:hypothetical protein